MNKALATIASLLAALSVGPVECRTLTHVLTTVELKALVPGHSIARSDLPSTPSYQPDVEQFRRDGTYLMLGDNFQDPGSYSIKDNMVCIHSRSYESLCRYLILDSNSQYWLVTDLNKKSYYKVSISKHLSR